MNQAHILTKYLDGIVEFLLVNTILSPFVMLSLFALCQISITGKVTILMKDYLVSLACLADECLLNFWLYLYKTLSRYEFKLGPSLSLSLGGG